MGGLTDACDQLPHRGRCVWVWSVRDEQVRIPRSCEGSGAVRDGAGLWFWMCEFYTDRV